MLQATCGQWVLRSAVIKFAIACTKTGLQAKPNLLQIETTAFSNLPEALRSGWYEAVMPEFLAPEGALLAPNIGAAVAVYYVGTGQQSQAASILARIAALGSPDASLYQSVTQTYYRSIHISERFKWAAFLAYSVPTIVSAALMVRYCCT